MFICVVEQLIEYKQVLNETVLHASVLQNVLYKSSLLREDISPNESISRRRASFQICKNLALRLIYTFQKKRSAEEFDDCTNHENFVSYKPGKLFDH